MNLFDKVWKFILGLFGKRSVDRAAESHSGKYRDDYEDISKVNFTAIMAESLSTKAVSDSTFNVTDLSGNDSRRSEWIQLGLEAVWNRIDKEVSQELGKGGKVLVPYVVDGRPYVDSIDQSRMRITAMHGDEITGVTLMSDTAWLDNRQYYRWTDYSVENGVHTIRNRATNSYGGEISLTEIPQWAEIEGEIVTGNVDHLLLAFLKSPADNRSDSQLYGVPITYGCGEILRQLQDCCQEMAQEYKLKKAFVGADSRLFGANDQLPESGLFRKLQGTSLTSDNFWQVFDPAIRDSAYLNRYEHLCAQLEAAVGVSPGILTKPVTTCATATEIRSAMAATFAYISKIRKSVEDAYDQLAYALDVLAEWSGSTPAGGMHDYEITWDWDMSMTESSSETFSQMSELESRGLMLPERLTSWVTGMDLDAAKEEVEEAQSRQEKPIDKLLMEE